MIAAKDNTLGESAFVRHLRGKYAYEFIDAIDAHRTAKAHRGVEVWTEHGSGRDLWYSRGYGLVDRLGYVVVSKRPLRLQGVQQIWYPGMPGYLSLTEEANA